MDALRKCWKHSLNAFFALALSIFTPAEKGTKELPDVFGQIQLAFPILMGN